LSAGPGLRRPCAFHLLGQPERVGVLISAWEPPQAGTDLRQVYAGSGLFLAFGWRAADRTGPAADPRLQLNSLCRPVGELHL